MPVETDDIINATPKTVVAGMSAFITSWFGLEHYAPNEPLLKGFYHGPNGEQLIRSEGVLTGALKNATHTWKASDYLKNTDCKWATEDVVKNLKRATDRFGLKKESELLNEFLKKDKSWLADKSLKGSREELREAMLSFESPFFNLLTEATDSFYARSSKSQEKIVMERGDELLDFFEKHNRKITSYIRNPLTIAITGSVMAAAAIVQTGSSRKIREMNREIEGHHERLEELSPQIERS